MSLDLEALPHGREVFDALRLGQHIDENDYKLYSVLSDHFDGFYRLFDYLGFELLRHDRRFFYFQGAGDSARLGKRARRMSVFFFVFIDALSTKGEDVVASLFRPEGHRIDHLPHFERVQHRDCLAEVDLREPDDLEELISSMERYNFVERIGPDEFRLRPPAWRFLEFCYAYVDTDEEE